MVLWGYLVPEVGFLKIRCEPIFILDVVSFYVKPEEPTSVPAEMPSSS